jgi:hypothetical protein
MLRRYPDEVEVVLRASLFRAARSPHGQDSRQAPMSPIRLRDLTRSNLLVGALTLATTPLASAQGPAADNTKVNARDRAKGAVMADQQKNDVADRLATQRIRRASR